MGLHMDFVSALGTGSVVCHCGRDWW